MGGRLRNSCYAWQLSYAQCLSPCTQDNKEVAMAADLFDTRRNRPSRPDGLGTATTCCYLAYILLPGEDA